jgi:hypothetical protein
LGRPYIYDPPSGGCLGLGKLIYVKLLNQISPEALLKLTFDPLPFPLLLCSPLVMSFYPKSALKIFFLSLAFLVFLPCSFIRLSALEEKFVR